MEELQIPDRVGDDVTLHASRHATRTDLIRVWIVDHDGDRIVTIDVSRRDLLAAAIVDELPEPTRDTLPLPQTLVNLLLDTVAPR